MERALFLFALLLVTASAGAVNAPAQARISAGLEQHLQNLGPDQEVAVIVRFVGKTDFSLFNNPVIAERRSQIIQTLQQKAAHAEKPLLNFLNGRAARQIKSLWLINGVALKVPARVVDELRRVPRVESISLDATLAAPAPLAAGSAPPEWNLSMIGAPQLWQQGYFGQGVVVANLDTGVDPLHQDIGPKWRGGSNSWFDPSGEYSSPHDSNGHGTQTMGLMVGGDAGGSAIGVAPGAQWIAARIFNNSGTASYSNIHLAFQWLLDPDGNPAVDDAPDVVSNSWGLGDAIGLCQLEFQADVDVLRAAGIAVVISAGNSGPGPATSLSPANYAQVLSVGAIDELSAVANFSSRGPSSCDGTIFPAVTAPGVNVRTADLTFGGLIPNSYAYVSGTSFAAPQVAGGIALLKSAQGQATASEIEAVLGTTAVDIDALGDDNNAGHGLVDLVTANERLKQLLLPGSLQFSAEVYSVHENTGQITITVTRHNGSAGPVSIDYFTQDGTALAGVDYLAAMGTLDFADGVMSRSFTITLIDDLLVEGDETISVHLTMASGGATLGWPDTAVVTLVDDESLIPVDGDGDGYAANIDCNDADPTVYPAATEIKHDAIDQDCNGYDLTIDFIRSEYKTWGDKLIAEATSTLAGDAQLRIQGYGPMFWDATRGTWLLTVKGVGGNPGVLTVSGIEGAVQSGTCTDPGPGVYPGALEIKHDGIDQDCNGYDLTIDIVRAEYKPWGDKLIVEATSSLGYNAQLSLDGHGLMYWSATRGTWLLTVSAVGGNPGTVNVSGIEGSEQAPVN